MQNIKAHFVSYFFVMKVCWHSTRKICWYICWYTTCIIYNFITRNDSESSNILAKYSAFYQLHVPAFQVVSFLQALCYFGFLHSHRHLFLFHFWPLFHTLYLIYIYLHLHDMCFNILESFITFIISKRIKFKCSVLFGTRSLLDRLLTILQLPVHLSKVIEMDSNIIFQCID